MTSWVKEEFSGISLGDQRLNERFLKVAEAFLERPSGSMSEISGSWADTKLSQHVNKTISRISRTRETVLAIQDTTYLDYSHHPRTEGLGKLSRHIKDGKPIKGLVLHNTLAISSTGVPLGLLDQKIYLRGEEDLRRTQWNKKRPIEQKESYRWIEVAKKTAIYFKNTSGRVVHVCDRDRPLLRADSTAT